MADMPTAHIWYDARCVAWIDDTNTKVVEVALDHFAHGWSAEEIQLQHRHLSLAQIHAALSYYYDHREDLDRQILEMHRSVQVLRDRHERQPLREELRQRLAHLTEERKSA